ncbi:MAG: hypothetical protein HY690_13220 [Chloroflexi bacterium]|nr:hypothetical protein [Chloroflexota bacterium]
MLNARTTAATAPRPPSSQPAAGGPPTYLKALAVDVFRAVGALVEEDGGGLVEVLLPDAYQDRLDGASFLRLAFDPQAPLPPDAQLVTIGSPLTEQIVTLAEDLGLAARWYVNGLKWSQRQAIGLDRWRARFTNARFLGDGVEMAFACHHVLMNFRVSYVSDEKREELRTVVVDVHSLQPAPLLQRLWARLPASSEGVFTIPAELRPAGVTWSRPVAVMPQPDFYLSDRDELPSRGTLETLHQRTVALLEREIAESIATYQRHAARQLELERLRIETFYADSEAELQRRLERAETDERRAAVQAKIEAGRLDCQRKLADIQAKHRLRVVVQLLNAAFITQPKVRTHVKVENRYASAGLDVVLDPLTMELELPTCQSCAEVMASVHLCAAGHLVCDACARPCAFCKREYCRDCGMATCAVCGRPICPQSQVRCSTCTQVTCPDDRGRCH